MQNVTLLILIINLVFLCDSIASPPTEYQVKAALIYNFLRFVDLKEDRVVNNEIHLCSFEKNPLNNEVKKLDEKSIGDRKILFSEVHSDSEIHSCSVLLVDKRDTESLKRIIEVAYREGILLIGDTDGYGELGVVINMFIKDEKVRFEINLEAANKSDVKVSSRLLSVAKIIKNLKK
ncbi:MAG: YfiR family protein [Myxococcota bacterium]